MNTVFSKDLNTDVILSDYVKVQQVDGSNKTDRSGLLSAKFAKLIKKIKKPFLMGSISYHAAGVHNQRDASETVVFEIVKIDPFNCVLYLKDVTTGAVLAIDGDDRYGRYVIVNEAKILQLEQREEQLTVERDSISILLAKIYDAENDNA